MRNHSYETLSFELERAEIRKNRTTLAVLDNEL